MNNIKLPQYKIDWSSIDKSDADLVKSVDVTQTFMATLQQEMSRFMYEPKNDQTMEKMGEYITNGIRDGFQGAFIQNVDIDFMQDLEPKYDECRACAETSSYEEYKLKRAVQNLPDSAGSEREWFRMSQFRPGQAMINVSFCPPGAVQEIEITTKVL